jgi:hypothetical protein
MKCADPITAAAVVFISHKIVEEVSKRIKDGHDKRRQLEILLYRIKELEEKPDVDLDEIRGTRDAYYKLRAEYDIWDAEPRREETIFEQIWNFLTSCFTAPRPPPSWSA